MANKKTQGKTKSAQSPVTTGSLWLAGIGALSLARKRGQGVLGELVAEGLRLQNEAAKVVSEARTDAMAQVAGIVKPLKARAKQRLKSAAAAVEAGLAGVRSRLGVPSKADIDELAQRVGALSRQLKAMK